MKLTLTRTQRRKLSNLGKTYDLRFIILHGSYATGTAGEASDLDIAILEKNTPNAKQFLSLYHELSDLFSSYDLDCKTLRHADPLFRYEVITNSVLLYGNELEYEEYKAVSRRMYMDADSLFKLEQILIKKNQGHLTAHYA